MRKLSRRRTVVLVGTLFIIWLVGLLFHSLNSPAVGILDKSQPTPPPVMEVSKQKSISGKYVSFRVPTFLEYDKHAPLGGRNLEVFYFKTGSATNSWGLNIGVDSLSGGLENDPSYKLRTDNPGSYIKSQISAGGQTFTIFSDTRANYAKVAFISNGGKEATFGISNTNERDTDLLDQTMNAVLASLKWH